MATTAQLLRCLLISPGDLAPERQVVRDAIARWNAFSGWEHHTVVEPVGWETHVTPEFGPSDRHPQKLIDDQLLGTCDFGIALFWTYPGTSTDTHASGSLEEIELLRASGKTVHILFSTKPVELRSVQPDKIAALRQVKRDMQASGLYAEFATDAELVALVGAILAGHAAGPARRVFATRIEAAATIEALIRAEPSAMTIVGSTLGGTLRALPDLTSIVNSKGIDFRINLMIAAPEHLIARAKQEGLPAGMELEAAYERVYDLLQDTDIPIDRILLYDAPPTCSTFVFHELRQAIVNPFTLTDSAENTLAFVVDGVEYAEAFERFVRAHVERPLSGTLTMRMDDFIPKANEWAITRLAGWLIERYTGRGGKPLIVAINGETAVGKTRLAERLCKQLSANDVRCSVLSTDCWLRGTRAERRRYGRTGLNEESYDLDALRSAMNELLHGNTVHVPTYSHRIGRSGKPRRVSPADVLLVEGLMSTHPRIKPDLTIWLSHAGTLHMDRRIARDSEFRGYTVEAARSNWGVHEREWPHFVSMFKPKKPSRSIAVNRAGMWLLDAASS